MKCQVAGCEEEAVKEVHIILPKNNYGFSNFLLCKEHFCQCEAEWKRANTQREIYDIVNPETREVVEFT